MNNAISFPFSDTEDSEADSPQRDKFPDGEGEGVEEEEEENKFVGNGQVETERPIFATYLKKKGEQRRNWKKRWFVLRSTKMSYYKDDKEYEILNILPLSRIHAVSSIPLVKRKHVFGIVTKQRTYYLQAQDESEMDEWVENIRAALLKAFPQGEDRGILSPLLMASTSPRASLTVPLDSNLSPLKLSAVKEDAFSGHDTRSAEDEILIESALPPSATALPIPKPNQDILATKQGYLINPSPLSKSWIEEEAVNVGSESEDEEVSAQVAALENSSNIAGMEDKFKPTIFSLIGDSAPPINSPLIQGFLYKLRSGLGGVKSWKKYWFVIRNDKLTSYKNEQEYEVKRIISLPSVIAALAIDPIHGKEFSFRLVLAKKNFVFACKDEQSKQDWIRLIQDCISFYSKTDGP